MAIPTEVLLIDRNYILQFSQMNSGLEWAYVKPSVIAAQDIWLQQELGTDLYNYVLAQTAAGTIAGDYVTLKDTYIKPVVLYRTLADLVPHLKAKIDNGGLVERTSETTSPLGFQDTQNIQKQYVEKAEFYTKRMNDYLCKNQSSFPQYSTNTTDQLSSRRSTSVGFGVVNRTSSNQSNAEELVRKYLR